MVGAAKRMIGPAPAAPAPARPWSLLAIVCLPAVLAGCNPGPPGRTPDAPRVFDAPVEPVKTITTPRLLPVPGNVVAGHEILVSAKISGYLRRLPVEEGQEVAPEQLLAEIDPSAIENEVAQAEAAVRVARATLEDAQRDLSRQNRLRGQGMVSEAALNKAVLAVETANAQLDRARSQLATSRDERRYTHILSPVRARVVQRLRQAGDLATPGQPVLRLQALEGNQFEAHVPLGHADKLRTGQRIAVGLDKRDRLIEGSLTHLVAAADPVSRTVKIKIALPPAAGIVPGLFGRALLADGEERVVAVPAASLVERLGVPGAFVVDPQGVVRFASVAAGRAFDGWREVLAGLDDSERVVAVPPAGIRDGDRIESGRR